MDAPQSVAKCSVPVDPVLDLAFLRTLVDFAEAERRHPSRDNAVDTTSVILWMRVFQRLNPEVSIKAAVKSLIVDPPDYLPDHVRSPAKLGVAVTLTGWNGLFGPSYSETFIARRRWPSPPSPE